MRNILWPGEEILLSTRGEGPADWYATGISIDSRTTQPGDVFIALKGPAYDGHDYAAAALDAGAAAAIISRPPGNTPPQARLIRVHDTFAALQDMGSRGRTRAQGKIIAVTGSVGKTGSKEQLRAMLQAQIAPAAHDDRSMPARESARLTKDHNNSSVFASQGSFNNHWGVPLSLAQLPQDADWGVFELGMNHAGEMTALARQVQPHVALITNIEAVHLEFFASLEAIADAKAEIFLGMNAQGAAILNRDNPHYARLVGHARTQGIQTILGFGQNAGADARLIDFTLTPDTGIIRAEFFGKVLEYRIGAPGLHYAVNSLGTLLAAYAAGAALESCAAALADFTPPPGRGSWQRITLPGGGAMTLIDESYNASPVATRAAIAVLGQTAPEPGGRRIAILGDMRELGATAPQLHAELAAPLCAAKIDQVFCCGHVIQGLFENLPAAMRGRYTRDSKAMAALLPDMLHAGDVVLVKGSKSVQMNFVIDAVRQMHDSAAA